MSSANNEAIMRTYLEQVLGNRDFEQIDRIAASNFRDSTQPHLEGPEALHAHAKGFCANTPDVKIDVVKVFATDTTAVGIWRWHGEPAVPSTTSAKGTPVVPRVICSVFEIEEDQIVDYQVYIDAMDIFTQLAQ